MPRFALTAVCLSAAILYGIAGCGGPSNDFKPAKSIPVPAAGADLHDHDHAEGPHHGGLVEIGEEEFHAEVVLDDKAHTLTVYLLGPDAKSEASTAAGELTITTENNTSLTLKPAEGSPEGKHQVFVLTDAKPVHDLAEQGYLHGTLKVTIGEKEFSAPVDVHFDGEHAHDAPK